MIETSSNFRDAKYFMDTRGAVPEKIWGSRIYKLFLTCKITAL